MILLVPDLDTLRLVLTSGTLPPAVALAPVAAAFDARGQLWLQPSTSPSRTALANLRRLKVQVPRGSPVPLTDQYSCWPQLLPIEYVGDRLVPPEGTPVLFDLPAAQLAPVVTEILRLGNDRQSFRHLYGPDSSERVLLRVVGPPYYSLLRALDPKAPDTSPVAYVEAAPRLWIEVGHTHPLANLIRVPDGKLLLLRPVREWIYLDDAAFRDIFEILEFPLPAPKVEWQDHEPGARLRVPLRLVPGEPADVDELWVLRDRPHEQLDVLVQNASDDLLRQLSFAVAAKDDRPTVVVRIRPTRSGPPTLVLRAVAFRSYQKMPNLFVPSGRRLHPPLSRHVLRTLLADDPEVITWLYPNEDGGFTPETLPDQAFRPLGDWIDYVLDREREPLQAWMQAFRFDFQPFVCPEDQRTAQPRPVPAVEHAGAGERQDLDPLRAATAQPISQPEEPAAVSDVTATLPQAGPSALEQQVVALQERFLALAGPLDSDARRALWPNLASLNAALGRGDDAGLCWMNALWLTDAPSASWCWNWFCAEAAGLPLSPDRARGRGRSWAAAAALAPAGRQELDGSDLDRALTLADLSASDVRALAAYLAWSAHQRTPPPGLVERLPGVRQFVEDHEKLLPVRAAWLAWLALARLARGDVLALARARDRLLERLFVNGLSCRQDLPGFLRWAGRGDGERLQAVRLWLRDLCDRAHDWVQRSAGSWKAAGDKTGAYVDLLFAFGLARVGALEACRQLVRRAQAELDSGSDVHSFLLQAFDYRVRQALEGKPHAGPLPAEHLEYLSHMARDPAEKHAKYMVDSLRQRSRILEPGQQADAYRFILSTWADARESLVARLPDMVDREQLAEAMNSLLAELPRGAGAAASMRASILRRMLDQAPRVSQEFAREVLSEAAATYDALPAPVDQFQLNQRVELLEKAVFVAGHFDWADHVQALVDRFERLLESAEDGQVLTGLDGAAGECFRGLRKLGLRQEMDRLLTLLASRLLGGRTLATLTPEQAAGNLCVLGGLLHVAAGWYELGRNTEADKVLSLARAVLFRGQGETPEESALLGNSAETQGRARVACTYAAALGLAPGEAAQAGIEELFEKLEGIHDTFTTHSYYQRLQLEIVEAVVWAVVSDDFTMGPEARRWLDDDEFLIRRRIHRDMRALTGIES
jgi:hypothetical protein